MIEATLFVLAALGYLVAGGLVIRRVPRNAVGWILAAIGGLLAMAAATEHALVENLWLPAMVTIALPLVFPDGRPFWRWVAWIGAGGVVLGTLDVLDTINTVLLTVAAIGAAVSLIVRLRRSHGAERQQVKWFAYIAGLIVIALIAATASDLGGVFAVVGPPAGLILLLLIGFGIPFATGVAVLRHRLYDIDVVIKRTLVYTALTVTLAVAYLASVLLLQLILSPSSDVAIAASTLAVAALFRPARKRIQALVDRRFYRSSYDARRTVETFAARLRDDVTLDALDAELRAVVRETMQPAHVTLWVR
jgi:hypothetical protein